jgi:MSHA biogenesis protein MshL
MSATLTIHRIMILLALASMLLACQSNPVRKATDVEIALEESLAASSGHQAPAPPPEVSAALLPRLEAPTTQHAPAAAEQRFDVTVENAPAREFFMSLVAGTDRNMAVHPNVAGTISLNLKNVTVEEALGVVQDIYGYQYRRNQGVYQILPARMRSKIFKVNYLNVTRKGNSTTRISSGQVSEGTNSGNGSAAGAGQSQTPPSRQIDGMQSGSQVETNSVSSFWSDLEVALNIIISKEDGRNVVVNPHAGVVLVRAMPSELRDAEDFLATIQEAAIRQVLLEAKILEVTLRDNFQAGINWTALAEVGNNKTILFGQTGGDSIFKNGVSDIAGNTYTLGKGASVTGIDTTALGGMFSINANLNDFNALIELLQVQGDVHVLSSPRVATVNNEKAVIKVGTDEFFVTDVSTDTNTSTTGTNQTVDISLTPFFSGVALDVVPQINDTGDVTLHIHPTVSQVTESVKNIAVSTENSLSIPLAMSTVRESDTIIRAQSGQVVVIGGLMENTVRDTVAKTPLLGDLPLVGGFFRHKKQETVKSELVILLRPVVEQGNQLWTGDLVSTADRFRDLQRQGRAGERDKLFD